MNRIILGGLVAFFLFGLDNGGWLDRSARSGIHRIQEGEVELDFTTRSAAAVLSVRAEGDVRLRPDGSGIERLGDGDYLDATLERSGDARRVRFDGLDGRIERRYLVGAEARAWDADADRVVAELMPLLFRETGLQAEERVAWLLEQRGPQAVLDEIELIDGDVVQRRYTVAYAQTGPLPDAALHRLLRLAERGIGLDPELRTALIGVYRAQNPAGERLAALIEAAGSIGLDSELGRVLVTVLGNVGDSDAAARAYLAVAGSIGLDPELRRVLSDFAAAPGLSDDAVADAIMLAGRAIGLDPELASFLVRTAPRVGDSDALARAYVTAADSLGLDPEHKRALLALAERANLSTDGWRMLLESARGIGLDFECAALLAAIAPRLPDDEAVIDAYLATAETIGLAQAYRHAVSALRSAR